MFQYLRTGDAAFLGDMTYQNHRHTCLLGKTKEHCRGFLDLCNRAWRRLDILGKHCLDRVHHHQIRHYLSGFSNDVFHKCLAVNQAVGAITPDTGSPEFHLLCTFLTGNIESFQMGTMKRDLER